jgi:hypothetical protein
MQHTPALDAESIDAELRRTARSIADDMLRSKALIAEARERCVHDALGFASWTAYVADVIGKAMGQLPIDDRRQVVALLAGESRRATNGEGPVCPYWTRLTKCAAHLLRTRLREHPG